MSESKSETEPTYDDQPTGTDDLHDLPPSAKLVFKILEYEGEQTQAAIADKSRLPSRTVRYAIGKLEAVDAIDSRVNLGDARQSIYRPADTDAQANADGEVEVAVDGA